MKSFLLVLVMAGMICITGCLSLPKDMFDPLGELQQGTLKFQLTEKHWPRNYEELSDFLKQSDDPTYTSLQAVKFHRVNFIELPDGGIKIETNYTTASGDATVSDSLVMSAPQINHEEQDIGR